VHHHRVSAEPQDLPTPISSLQIAITVNVMLSSAKS
jgi:hypothetical protein